MPEFDRRPVKKPSLREMQSDDNPQRRPGKNRVLIRRRENVAVSILRGLFPWKGDEAGDIIRKLIFMGSLVLLFWASFQILDFYVLRPNNFEREWQNFISIRDNYEGDDIITIPISSDSGRAGSDGRDVEVIGKYYEYYLKNDHFVGWVEIFPIVQYPVYQYTDNEFYLHHNHDRVRTANGTIFADYEGVFGPGERPHNTIIYGHNLRNNHLFQPLVHYRSDGDAMTAFEFLKLNPIIKFDTLYDRGNYKIFAVFQSNVRPRQGEVFRYWDNIYFESKSHFDNFVADILDRSLYYTNVDLQYGDELLMLSTCDFSVFANGADSSVRLVVAARRVRDNEYFKFSQEEIDAFIDNRGRDENGNLKRKMFDAYYTLRRSQWGGRNWDTSYIKDFAG